jgi:hypothetical protein
VAFLLSEILLTNPIYNTTTKSKIPVYIDYAISCLQEKENLFFVGVLGGSKTDHFEYSAHDPNKPEIKNIVNALINFRNSITAATELKEYKDFISNKMQLPYTHPNNGKKLSVAHIAKPSHKIPLGYLAETILQSALVVRFTQKRTGAFVTRQDMIQELKQFLEEKSNPGDKVSQIPGIANLFTNDKSKTHLGFFKYEIANENRTIRDDVVYVAHSLNDSSFKWMRDRIDLFNKDSETRYSELEDIIRDAIKYVNMKNVVDHAKIFYTNGKRDRIDILSYGTIGQMEKVKEDLKVVTYEDWDGTQGTKSPNPMTLNISVKIRNVEQVAQVSGIRKQNIKQLVETLGFEWNREMKDSVLWNQVEDKIAKNNKRVNFKDSDLRVQIYKLVFEQIAKQKISVSDFVDGLHTMIAGNNREDFQVVNLGGGLKVYYLDHVEDFKKRYSDGTIKIVSKPTTSSQNLFFSIVHKGSEYPTLKLSGRYTGGVNRNFISISNESSFKKFLAQEKL